MKIFGNKCELCGYDKCIRNLEFHHVYPETKAFGIAARGRVVGFRVGLKEAKKCILACSNCHGEIEAGLRIIPQHLIDRIEV